MFKKTERLTRKQFTAAFAAGKRTHFKHCTIVFTPSPTLHVSVVAGKKVAKSAVVRNQLRRRVYAQLRTELKRTHQTGTYIVLLKPLFATLPRKTANRTIQTAVAEVGKST